MLLKKLLLNSAMLALISMPLMASAVPAKLHTENYTDQDSTVKITSNSAGACAGSFGQYTPKRSSQTAPGVSEVSWSNVKMLCLGSGNTCKADIYMSRDCSGPVVAKSELNLGSGDSTIVQGTVDAKYNITASGPNVKLAYAGK